MDPFQAFQAELAGVQAGRMPPPPGPPPMFAPPPHMPPPGYFHGVPAPPPPGVIMYQPPMPAPAPPAGAMGAGPSGAGKAPDAAAGEKKKKGQLREAAGQRWRDPTLDEWPKNDFRIFVGDLGNDVNDDVLAKAFQKYPSFAKAKVVKDKRTKKSKGFGFVSFLNSEDFAKALREMNGKYVGNRPIKLRKSSTEERAVAPPPKKQKK